jgi:4-alpha-glucanotransferase
VQRRAGLLVPLFALVSSRSWGIGEIPDIVRVAPWLHAAGMRVLQLLPINEMPVEETSPYSALSAMAIDPQFIAVPDVEEFRAAGGEDRLDPELRARLDAVRASPTVDYLGVRALKQIVLRRAFERFQQHEMASGSARAAAFARFVEEQAWWLSDYAVFRALHAAHGERGWQEWPEPQRNREAEALSEARRVLAGEILYRQYLQWLAHDQWAAARAAAGDLALFGDLPFMVSGDSPDVWSRQEQFRMDASVGVPPDAFSDTGQDWGLPVYRWDVCASRDFDWLRARARRNAELFDGYRVDHLVGFYRTYFRPHDGGEAEFTPPDEASQIVQGERVLGVFREPGAEIIAEDLGVVPDFVRESLERLGVPGYKVLRWERHWHEPGQPFKDPGDYPPISVATSGTHDTEPMVTWWEGAPADEKAAVLDIPQVRARIANEARSASGTAPGAEMTVALRDALVETLMASGSALLILPIQDVFGWRDRINQPATIGASNWTWRLPWFVDRLADEREAQEAADRLRGWRDRYAR